MARTERDLSGQAGAKEVAAPGVATSLDAFLGGRFHLHQWRRGYRAGLDAMLLAATVTPPGCDDATPLRVLDFGCGAGAVSLAMAVRCRAARIIGIERDAGTAALARRNVRENGLGKQVKVVEGDVTRVPLAAACSDADWPGADWPNADWSLAPDTFDHVVINPPFHDPARSRSSPDASKAAAHAMPDAELELWLRRAAGLLKPGGSITAIHRANALATLLTACEGPSGGRFGNLRLRFIHSRAGATASRVLVRGRKGNRAPLTIAPPLVVHQADGTFMDDVAACLDHRAAALTV